MALPVTALFPRTVAALAAVLLCLLAMPVSSADLFLTEEPEVYSAIDRLSALGYLPMLPVNKRPLSLRGIRAAVDQASRADAPPGFDGELLEWLSGYVAPKEAGRVTGSVAHSDARFFPANGEGIPVPKGWSGAASVFLRETTTPLVNGQLRFLSYYGEGGDDGNRLLDSSLEIGWAGFAVQAGKISTWYGPGRNGALVFSNNAQPYPGVRIHNPEAIPAPGFASFLGSLQYDFFAARMEKKERFSHSVLVGTRLAARPGSLLELGFSRALHYGGEGRDDGLSEFIDDYFGDNEPSDRSNSLAGFDVSLSLPLPAQPFQVYFESAIEDSSHVSDIFLPWADRGGHLFGLYLPRIFRLPRLGLRAEYADTFSGEAKGDDWYDHSAYPHRYRGQVLGHAMGGSARDWYFEARYHPVPGSYAAASYENVLHDGPDRKGERRQVISAELAGWLSRSWRGEARVSWDRVEREGGTPGRDGSDLRAWIGISWHTDTLLPSEAPGTSSPGILGARR